VRNPAPSGREAPRLIARSAAALAAALLLAVTVFLASAGATRSQLGHVIVSLDARFSPRALPRHRPAPVSISFSGVLQTDDGSPLPRLHGIEIALASGSSRLNNVGLPVCPHRLLVSATESQGRQRCPNAIVGQGSLGAQVEIPGQEPFPVVASVLAFNGGERGVRAVIWLLAYSSDPPASFVVPVYVRHRRGPLGTSLTGVLPASLGPWPHVSGFHIAFSRRFKYRGRVRSYLSASCPVPPRFTGGLLPFARATYFFTAGLDITTTVARACHVR
jgi:hypothetical protein